MPRIKRNSQGSSLLHNVASNWQMYVMLFPFMFFFFLFTVWPVIASIFVSFTEYNVLEAPRFVGLDNYRRLFLEDDIFAKSIGNTLVFAVVTGPLGYMISFFTSWVINEFGRFTKALLTFIFYIPSISGTVYTIWGLIFDSDIYGYANSFLIRLGIIDDPINWLTNETYILPLIIIVQLWMSMGVGFLAMRAGFSTTDSQYYEAGAIDGIKNRWQELWYLTIPMMAPHLTTAAVLQITAMFSNAAVSETLAGNPSTNYAGHLLMNHFNDYSGIRLERGYASAIAVLLFVFIFFINRIIMKMLRKVGA
ncbi:MAG: sugar ABC transporter permease [Clostridia bacterium]|nr:sugar ABC transporter permease [Clostridia bacterium]